MKVDPKLQYCQCGYTWKFSRWELLLMFLGIRNKFRCPQCQSVMEFKIIYHTVKLSSERVFDDSIWKNG